MVLSGSIKGLLGAVNHLLFPALCLECDGEILDQRKVLCGECVKGLELLEPIGRCRICFSQLVEESILCERCQVTPPALSRIVAPFVYVGAARELLDQFLSGKLFLRQTLAAYMVLQFLKMELPWPDRIVPVPSSRVRRWQRGFCPSELLARGIGELLERPVSLLLGRRMGSFSQRRLGWEERKKLDQDLFFWKKREDLFGERLLLVDDLVGSGATLSACSTLLAEGFPSQLVGLTFCLEELY